MSTTLARFLTVAGAVGAIVGVFLAWIDDVTAAHLPLRRLLGWDMEQQTDVFVTSVAMVVVVGAVVALVGALLPSRAAGFVGGLAILAPSALLLVQEHLFLPHGLSADLLGAGVWCTLVSAALVLVGSAGLSVDVQRDLIRA